MSQMNNVEQVSIESPEVNSIYEVRLQAKVFTEALQQNVSVIITSGNGDVSNKTVTSHSEGSFTYNALSCSDDEQMMVIRKADRGGDGWRDAYYLIEHQDPVTMKTTVVLNATMVSTASADIVSYDYICLAVGEVYNISIHDAFATGSEIPEMGVTVQQCGVYLSEYLESALLSITATDMCNPCGDVKSGSVGDMGGEYSLQVVLVGSLYGIPYGTYMTA